MQINEAKKNNILMDLTMAKMFIDKATKETKESEVAHYRDNEYLKMVTKLILNGAYGKLSECGNPYITMCILDSYINWYTYDKI